MSYAKIFFSINWNTKYLKNGYLEKLNVSGMKTAFIYTLLLLAEMFPIDWDMWNVWDGKDIRQYGTAVKNKTDLFKVNLGQIS